MDSIHQTDIEARATLLRDTLESTLEDLQECQERLAALEDAVRAKRMMPIFNIKLKQYRLADLS